MRLVDIIKASKESVLSSPWGQERIKTKDFPLSKKRGRCFPLTARWRWRVTTFSVKQSQFRLLAAYHVLLPEFVAVLGQHVGTDCRVLARWEYHGSHDGWHVHASCGQTANITPGIVKPAGLRRLPEGGAHHRNKELVSAGFVMSDVIAEAIAFDLSGIPYTPDLLTRNALPWT